MPVLDAHKDREGPYQAGELPGYKDAKPPKQEQEAKIDHKLSHRKTRRDHPRREQE